MTNEPIYLPPRLRDGQSCVVHALDVRTAAVTDLFRTRDILLEAPNWLASDQVLLNGEGHLWRLAPDTARIVRVESRIGLPKANNDHVIAPDGGSVYLSGYDFHIHRLDLRTGEHARITRDDAGRPIRHFLHGVSPDGGELALVGIEPGPASPWGAANIFTMPSHGGDLRQLTFGDRPKDGPEYSPDGRWIYFNTETFGDRPGHAQIARMARDGGTMEQLTADDRVNWFPHLAPDGEHACFLAYPPGTIGHPADQDVEIRLVRGGRWNEAATVARFNGGQGTINVNSWSPDGSRFAFVSYPFDT